MERINEVIMQIIAMYVAADHKNWDTYLPSATFAYNTSLSETTDNTPFFLTYGHEPVKLPNVALLLPMVQSNSVVYHQERFIRQVAATRQLAALCTQQAQHRMKLYYYQHAKDYPVIVGHKVWIYNPAVKPGISKILCSLWHGPFCLWDQITPVFFKVFNLPGKLQKGSVHVNQMKQHFKYDDPPQYDPIETLPEENYELLESPAESCENIEMKFPDIFLENYIEKLAEINLLPELMKLLQLKQKTKRNQDKDNHFDITTLSTHAFNRGKKVLLTQWKKKHLLAIMVCLIVCLTL